MYKKPTTDNQLITQQTDTDESVYKDNSTALVQTLLIFKRDLAMEGISVRFLIDSGSAINIVDFETFSQIKKKNRNLFLKPTKTKILRYSAKNVSSLQMKDTCQLTVKTGAKITTALFYVIDSNSHYLLTGACAIELDLICLPRTTSEKCDERTKLQEVFVLKEEIVRQIINSQMIEKFRNN